MLCKEIFVNHQGIVTVLEGIRVIKTQLGKCFVKLGDAEGGRRIIMDSLYPPEVLDISDPSEPHRKYRIFEAAVKTIKPRNGGSEFMVLSACKPGALPQEGILLRLASKFSNTPPLIFGIKIPETAQVLAEGFVDGGLSHDLYADRLLVLPKGAELRFETTGGRWLFVNHGAGFVQLIKLNHEVLGESPLAMGLQNSLKKTPIIPPTKQNNRKERSVSAASQAIELKSESESSLLPDTALGQALYRAMSQLPSVELLAKGLTTPEPESEEKMVITTVSTPIGVQWQAGWDPVCYREWAQIIGFI